MFPLCFPLSLLFPSLFRFRSPFPQAVPAVRRLNRHQPFTLHSFVAGQVAQAGAAGDFDADEDCDADGEDEEDSALSALAAFLYDSFR